MQLHKVKVCCRASLETAPWNFTVHWSLINTKLKLPAVTIFMIKHLPVSVQICLAHDDLPAYSHHNPNVLYVVFVETTGLKCASKSIFKKFLVTGDRWTLLLHKVSWLLYHIQLFQTGESLAQQLVLYAICLCYTHAPTFPTNMQNYFISPNEFLLYISERTQWCTWMWHTCTVITTSELYFEACSFFVHVVSYCPATTLTQHCCVRRE